MNDTLKPRIGRAVENMGTPPFGFAAVQRRASVQPAYRRTRCRLAHRCGTRRTNRRTGGTDLRAVPRHAQLRDMAGLSAAALIQELRPSDRARLCTLGEIGAVPRHLAGGASRERKTRVFGRGCVRDVHAPVCVPAQPERLQRRRHYSEELRGDQSQPRQMVREPEHSARTNREVERRR